MGFPIEALFLMSRIELKRVYFSQSEQDCRSCKPAFPQLILGANEALHIGFKFKAYVVTGAFFFFI